MSDQKENVSRNEKPVDFSAIMKRLDESNSQQARYAKKQYRMAQLSAAANILVLLIVIYMAVTLIPKVNATFRELDIIMNNMETITSELADADIDKLVKDVDQLVTNSEQDLTEALEKLNAIDFDTLNSAIRNLNDAVAPLAKLSGYFK